MRAISIAAVFITLIACLTIYYTTVDKGKVLTDPLAQQLSTAHFTTHEGLIKAYYAHRDSCK